MPPSVFEPCSPPCAPASSSAPIKPQPRFPRQFSVAWKTTHSAYTHNSELRPLAMPPLSWQLPPIPCSSRPGSDGPRTSEPT
jgi:hypothetical protein